MNLFKNLAVSMCLIVQMIGFTANAADNFTYEETEFKPTMIAEGLEFGFTYFLGNKIVGNIPGGDFTIENVAINQALVPAPCVRYQHVPFNGFGYNFGGRVELGRPLSRNRWTVGSSTNSFIPDSAYLSVIIGEANLTYGVDHGYFFIGPNYNFPLLYNASAVQMQGGLGRQLGIGWATDWTLFGLINPKPFTFEFLIQEIVITLTDVVPGSGYSRGTWAGMGLRGGVTF